MNKHEGIDKLAELKGTTDLILIGGWCSTEQRKRIVAWYKENLPNVPISQSGMDYPYSNDEIYNDAKRKLNYI